MTRQGEAAHGAAAPRVVLFDAVGTLIHPRPSVAEAYGRAARAHGAALSNEEIDARFRAAFRQVFGGGGGSRRGAWRPRASEQLEKERWRRVVARVFPDVRAPGELFRALWRHFARPENWRVYDDARDCWNALAARGWPLGIASNFDARLAEILAGLQPLDACERVYWSAEIGYAKPSPVFFREIERRLGRAKREVLLVGDDPVNDRFGGRAAGWRTLLVDRQADGARRPPALASLRALPPLLGEPSGPLLETAALDGGGPVA